MKALIIFALFFGSLFSAQKQVFRDSLKLPDTEDFFVDDYRSVYLYKSKDFSLTKYDSLGKQLGRIMMTVPFRVQSVQNPLNIFLFSENAQELKLLDSNLNEIQKVDFRQKFGFVKAAYAEDLQQIWLMEESTKRLIQYNYRRDLVLNSFPVNIDFGALRAILVYDNRLYTITETLFSVFSFKGEKLAEFPVEQPRKIYRENDRIYVISQKAVSRFALPDYFKTVFSRPDAKIVDKNTTSFFELKGAKLYLYTLGNQGQP